ncbi:MAG: hypothetical protein EOP48_07675 [Sphingobacteriales bacterium]|nr:MAG: hypothetical protein EOP48_07675 [Sphingobacteriales bacterium]
MENANSEETNRVLLTASLAISKAKVAVYNLYSEGEGVKIESGEAPLFASALKGIGELISIGLENEAISHFQSFEKALEMLPDELEFLKIRKDVPISSAVFDLADLAGSRFLEAAIAWLEGEVKKISKIENESELKIATARLGRVITEALSARPERPVRGIIPQTNKTTTEGTEPETVPGNSQQKIKWKGTPAQFGFIIDLLIQGGYIERPTGTYAKDATFWLDRFDIDTTYETLKKELSEKTNSLARVNRNKIKIPELDKLG